MAQSSNILEHTAQQLDVNGDSVLPGTIFPIPPSGKVAKHHQAPPQPTSQPGPDVDGRRTTVTLYTPASFLSADAELQTSLISLVNRAFSESHRRSNTLPPELDRLDSAPQLARELGDHPDTFLYVLTWATDGAGAVQPLGVAAGRRWLGDVVIAGGSAPPDAHGASPFARVGAPPEGIEGWELKHTAVDTALQGRGLAGYLMALVEGEVRRRSLLAAKTAGEQLPRRELKMFLTTMKEANERFYLARGYATDKEVRYDEGTLDSATAFAVLHMSKRLAPAETEP